jgi:hypothetical protein
MEAVPLYRQLAEARPDAFLPYLASTLNNLGASAPLSAVAKTRSAPQKNRISLAGARSGILQIGCPHPSAFASMTA